MVLPLVFWVVRSLKSTGEGVEDLVGGLGHKSTRFSQLVEMGVKCRWKRGGAAARS
jgi:hypothetical protein